MRSRFLAVLLALSVLASAPVSPARAQDLDAIAGRLDLESLNGIQAAVSRTYATDIATLVESAGPGTPAAAPAGPLLMLALVAEFDTANHAENGASKTRDRLLKELERGDDDVIFDVIRFSTLGDRAWRITGEHASPNTSLAISAFIVWHGRWMSLSIAIGDDTSTTLAARGLIEFALDARAGADDVVYDVDGRSRGGLWAMLPGVGDGSSDTLVGTRPIYDNQVIPPAPPDTEG